VSASTGRAWNGLESLVPSALNGDDLMKLGLDMDVALALL
jgi:hypothetical protein